MLKVTETLKANYFTVLSVPQNSLHNEYEFHWYVLQEILLYFLELNYLTQNIRLIVIFNLGIIIMDKLTYSLFSSKLSFLNVFSLVLSLIRYTCLYLVDIRLNAIECNEIFISALLIMKIFLE